MQPNANVNITSAEFKANPYPFYARLRAQSPVCQVKLPNNIWVKQPVWLITRYDDVAQVLKDPRFAKNKRNALTPEQIAKLPWMPSMFKPLERNMLDQDEPDHKRLRALVHQAFTPRLIEQMQTRIQTLADELLDSAQNRGGMDVIGDYALLIPTTIIAEMLGVPVADRRRFSRWSKNAISATASKLGMVTMIPSIMALMRYIRTLIKARRANPQDDLISALVQAEEAGDQLSEDELVAMVFLLLVAGHETTVNLIGNGTLALLEYPDQMIKLRDDPALIKSAVEELLRYGSPVETATERFAREDVTIAGVTIPRGSLVLAVIASANRDERQFANPDTLDIARDPNKHLAFGLGIHYCLGAPLARMEGQIAINTLLRRVPNIQLTGAPEALRWRRGLFLRGLESLPVQFAVQRATIRTELRAGR